MKTAIYVRVSTEEQAKEGYSIPAQKERLTAYAQSQDWDIIGHYIDEGWSAKDTNRPELKRMLADIKNSEIEVVLVYKLDRLTRSVLDLYTLLETFDNHGTKFKSATEVYDTTTAIGRLFITLVAALAQWERENLGERVKVGMEQMTRQGKWHGSTPAFGYDYVDGELVINEKEARIVKEIFQKYLEGYGDNKITTWLNQKGYKTKVGADWSHTSVGYLICNPIYAGDLRWNYRSEGEYFTVEDSVPSIIDRDTFEQVQKLREARSYLHPRQATSTYIFSGRVRCGRCGSAMKGKKTKIQNREYRHYVCTKRVKGMCDLPYIEEGLLEKQFVEHMEILRENNAAFEVAAAQETTDLSKEIARIQTELEKIKHTRKKWQLAFGEDAMTLEELKARTEENRQRESELLTQLDQLNINAPDYSEREIANMLVNFPMMWEGADKQTKKVIVQTMLETLAVDSPFDSMPTGKFAKRSVTLDIQFN